jgi:hypothetical protein
MDDNLLAFSGSQVSNNTWMHLAAPFDLALLNDNLLSAEDCVSVSYMCQANPLFLFLPHISEQPSLVAAGAAVCYLPDFSPLFLPQMFEQSSAVFGSAAVCYMCQANPLFMPEAQGGDKLSAGVNASTATVRDAFLHMAAPTSLDRTAALDPNLLASSDSKLDMVAWLHLAPPTTWQRWMTTCCLASTARRTP